MFYDLILSLARQKIIDLHEILHEIQKYFLTI